MLRRPSKALSLERSLAEAKDLVCAVSFDDLTFVDLVSGYQGTSIGAPSINSGSLYGVSNSAVNCNGSSSGVNLGKGRGVDSLGAFTIFTWMRLNTYVGSAIIASKSDIGWNWYCSASNRQALFRTTAGFPNYLQLESPITTGDWHSRAVSADGSRFASGIQFWTDGIRQSTSFANDASTFTPGDAAADINLGSYAGARWANVDFAAFLLYSRQLGPGEMIALDSSMQSLFYPRRRCFMSLSIGKHVPPANQTVTPSKIPTHASWGSPVIAGPLKPTKIATHAAWPTPVIAAPLTINAAVLGPNRSWANATVTGPLSGLTIPTHSAWYSPTLNVVQTITPSTTIAGARVIGSPIVAFITVVSPAALAGSRSIPNPVVAGGPGFVNVYGIPARRSWPIVTVTGGDLACRIFIGGVDVTSMFSWSEGTTIASQTIGRWKATIALEASRGVAGYLPQLGQTVLIVDYGYRLFAGCITERVLDRFMMSAQALVVTLTATDKSGICDHRIIPGYTTPAGGDVAELILTIVGQWLNGEGIVPDVAIVTGAFGTLTSDLKFNFPTVTAAFDQIALLAGLVWWIDVFGVLYFSSFVDLPLAPFVITETSLNWRNAPGSYGMRVAQSTTDLYNKIYAVSNLNILPGSGTGGTGGVGAGNTESFVWTADGPGIMTITNGVGARVAVGIIASVPIGSISSLTVNGVAQTTVDFGLYAGQTASPPDLLWLWGGPATGSPGQQVQPQVLAAGGAAIVITYTPYVATSSSTAQYGTAINPLNPSGQPLGTCGSGILEGVVQVQNLSAQSDLDAFALASLNRVGGVPTTITFETDYPGLKPGQKLTVNVPLSGADNLATLITAVNGVFVPPTLNSGGSFRWSVTCRTDLDPGNWQKWYERLMNRTNNPLPVLQYEYGEFVLGAGSTLSGGVDLANPYIVKRTGKLIELLVAAAFPPTNQDLILEITATSSTSGTRILGTVTLPAGSPANQVEAYEVPDSLNLYVFARETLNVTATYSVIGTGTPVKARQVSLTARWAM